MSATPVDIARRALADHLAALPAGELLARYARQRDPEAFAALVRQFGPLVLGVCRRVLGPSPDADDAFQAVFVALARRAGSFRDARALPAWLHRVAVRTARKTLARQGRTGPLPDAVPDDADSFADVVWKDVRHVLDEELDRLPERYRGPVVLCWLDGLTQDEAAGKLGLSLNTLKRRLDAGRELLRSRLARRGLAPVLAAAAVLGPTGLRADVPSTLGDAVSRAAALVNVANWAPRLVALVAVAAAAAGGLVVVAAGRAPPEVAPPPRLVQAGSRTEPVAATVPLPPGAVARFGGAQFRAPDRIYSSALSPDGKLLAIGGHPVRVYEAATWKPVRQLAAEGNDSSQGAENLVFSPDGRYLGGANTQFAYLWDVKNWKLIERIDGGKMWRWTQYCVFTPDGHFVLSDKDKLRFYDPATAREVKAIAGGRTVALSPDGRVFARMTNYDRIKDGEPTNLWFGDAASGQELFTLDGFARNRTRPVFAPDGRSFALVAPEGTEIVVWDTPKKSPRLTLRTNSPVSRYGYGDSDIGFTADGKTIFATVRTGEISRWDAGTGQELPRLRPGDGPPLRRLHTLPDGKTLLTTSIQGWVRVWDAATGQERPVPGRYWDAVLAVAPDGKTAAVGDRSGRVDLLDSATGKLVRTLREKGTPVRNMVFSADGDRLALGEAQHDGGVTVRDALVRVLRVSDGTEVWSCHKEDDVRELVPLGFAAGEGVNLVIAHYPKGAQVWDTGTGKELRRLACDNFHAAVSPDGKMLATDGYGEVVLLDLATGREAKRIEVDPDAKAKGKRVRGAALFAWAGDGRTLATTLPKDHVCILDPATGKERGRFAVYTGEVRDILKEVGWRSGGHSIRSLCLSPDGKRLAVSALNGEYVAVWDTETGQELARLNHEFQVDTLAFTPDGRSVISFGGTGLGYRWDVEKVIAARKK
jgi:RNA polymerase sigma factor (sigma-70 family)